VHNKQPISSIVMFHGTELCRLTAVHVPVAIDFHIATACCPSTKYDQKEEGMDGTHDQERASYSLCLAGGLGTASHPVQSCRSSFSAGDGGSIVHCW
jgi:hypothetical protein